MTWFNRMALRTLLPSCLANPTFNTDSLVPSTDLNSLNKVPCAPGTAVATCADFATCASGCIDMYSVMAGSTSLADFQAKFATRYSATASCVTDITAQFTTNYNNWYVPRVDATNGIPSVKTRWDAGAKVSIAGVVTDHPPLEIKINTVLNTYGTLVPQLASANTGIFAGLDCTVLGEDFQLIKNAVCVKAFNSLYLSFVIVSIVSYLLIPVIVLFVLARKDEVDPAPVVAMNPNETGAIQ